MADGIKITCKVNLNGIAEKLLDIEPKITRNLLRSALKAVGTMWVEAIKSKVPVHLGDLKESITSVVRTRKGKKNSDGLPTGEVQAGPGMIPRSDGKTDSVGPGIYGMFVEFGTKAFKQEPYLRPVFDSSVEQAIDIFAETMKAGLAEAIEE
jgi:HK97 gp10 family phage protein